MRYADPTRCPDCRGELPSGTPVCPTCQLLVRHPIAVQLFGTLGRADALVTDLRAASDAFHQPAPVAVPATATLGGPVTAPVAPTRDRFAASSGPAPTPSAPSTPARTGVQVSSVPKILLGLGAFCLLTAGVIFLAVSWAHLGVGGRTGVLAAFTAASVGASLFLHRRGLRIAAESLSTVGLGMLGLDVLGAGAAGWTGTSEAWTAAAAGIVLAVAGTGLGLLRITGQPRLVAPQVVAAIGLVLAHLGASAATSHDLVVAHVATAAAALVAALGLRAGEVTLLRGAGAAALLAWAAGGLTAVARGVADPNLQELWAQGSGWSLVATGLWLLVPGFVQHDRRLLLAGASGTAVALTTVVTLPGIDSDLPTIGLLALGVTGVWVLALALLPTDVRIIAVAPAAAGALVLTTLSLATAAQVLVRWAELWQGLTDTAHRSLTLELSGTDVTTDPRLLAPSLLLIVALLALLDRANARRSDGAWRRLAGAVTGVGLAITLASYDVVLALPVGLVLLTAIACLASAVDTDLDTDRARTTDGLGGIGLLLAATVAALPSAPLTALSAAVAATCCVALALVRTDGLRTLAGLVVAPLVGLAVGHLIESAAIAPSWTAVPVLVAVGLLALAMPRVEIELSAAFTALIALAISLPFVQDAGGFAALWLSVAGFLCCASALLTPSRRPLAWVGSALLLLATWVRLADLSVEAPEAYTLPLAMALTAAGLWRLRRSPEASTVTALLPGLLLGTVPSLVWVLDDPLSVRALLLGAACLALVVMGATLRWNAPLLAGTAVGSIVVLREIGPYAGEVPQWVWIALAGLVLTGLGITWERRVLEVRRTVGFIGRLR